MEKITVLGVQLIQRIDTAPAFQEVITKHGCIIKTRIGLHRVENNVCSVSGVILLELIGNDQEVANLEKDIKALGDVNIQKMVFNNV